jgi:hypothetical protein
MGLHKHIALLRRILKFNLSLTQQYFPTVQKEAATLYRSTVILAGLFSPSTFIITNHCSVVYIFNSFIPDDRIFTLYLN